MTATMNNVMSELESLSTSEKGIIAKYLIASLDDKYDDDSTQAWAMLSKKRYEDIQSGKAKTVSWENMKASILG